MLNDDFALQVAAQVERNDAYLMADFLTKRGQHPVVGATHSPPRDFNFDSCSAVLGCFIKALAIAKVGAILLGCLHSVTAKGTALVTSKVSAMLLAR